MLTIQTDNRGKIQTQDHEMSTNPVPQNTFRVVFENFL